MAENKVTLISKDEKLVYSPLPGVKIVYRRAPDKLRAQWQEKFIKDERTRKVDDEACLRELIKYSLLSWEGVTDPDNDGKPAEANFENYERLDSWIQSDLALLMSNQLRGHVEVPLAVSPTGLSSN